MLSYEVIERAPCLGKTRLRVGESAWQALDRESAEALVGQGVYRVLVTEQGHALSLIYWGVEWEVSLVQSH